MVNMLIASLEAALECLRRFTGVMENTQRTTPRAHAKAFSERGGHLGHGREMIIEPLANQAVIRISGVSIWHHNDLLGLLNCLLCYSMLLD